MSVIKCPHCGKELPGESSFCPYCMERLNKPVAVTAPAVEKHINRQTVIMILAAIILLALVAGVVIWGLMKNTDGREKDKTTDAVNGTADTVTAGDISDDTSENTTEDVTGDDVPVSQGDMTQATPDNKGETENGGYISSGGQVTQKAPANSDSVTEKEDKPSSGGNVTPVTPTDKNDGEETTAAVNNAEGTTGSQVTECNHSWVAVKETVHYDEVGHFEDVERSRPITIYRCPMCYKEHTSLNLYYTHFDTIHVPSYQGDPIGMFREQYTTDTEYEYYTEEIWVVDREAYSETVTTGHKCSKCGKIR